jgi:thioredoxin 1
MKHVTEQNFQEFIEGSLPLVIDFSATWCGPCKKVAQVIEEIENEYEGKVIFGKCDVDECEDLAVKYGIRNVPTVLFIKNGEVVDKQVGAAAKNAIVDKIQTIL